MFKLPIRIYYEDTDAGGVVYYANYLRYAERARTEFIRAMGIEQREELDREEKYGFMVRAIEVEYKAPAGLDDLLEVTVEAQEVKGASCVVKQQVWRGETLLVEMKVSLVYVSYSKKRPSRVPEEMIRKFEGL